MRLAITLAAFLIVLTLSACDTAETVRGGGTENGGYARAKIGVPF